MIQAHLPHRAIFRLKGEDRYDFLQGLISNDIMLCKSGQAIYAALLTPQGKFLHDMFIIEKDNAFLIDAEAARLDDLIHRLNRHKLRAKIVIEDTRNDYAILAAWDSIPAPTNILSYPDPRLPELGTRTITPKASTASEATTSYDHHRLTLGVADGSRDMQLEKSTLLEGNFDLLNGISWTKGCYMGQELTARTHYRGLVKKRLFPVTISGTTPEPESLIYWQNAEIGIMRSSCNNVGLALLNVEKAQAAIQENGILHCNESKLSPYLPLWMKNSAKNLSA